MKEVLQKRPEFKLNQLRKMLGNIFILTALVILVLPVWNIFQEVLTSLVINLHWYKVLSEIIVPYELKIVGLILTVLQFPIKVGKVYIEFTRPDRSHEAIYLIWNCVGWQSAVFLIVTLITGLSGKHSLYSKLETLVLGFLGTYLVNILRLCLVIMVYYFLGRLIGSVFHDYISNLLTLVWLFVFWWYSYTHILIDS